MSDRPPIQAKIIEGEFEEGRRFWRMSLFNEDGTPFSGGEGGGGGAVFATLSADWAEANEVLSGGRLLIPPTGSGLDLSQLSDPAGAVLSVADIRLQIIEAIRGNGTIENFSFDPEMFDFLGNVRFGDGLSVSWQPNPVDSDYGDLVIEAEAPAPADTQWHRLGQSGEPAYHADTSESSAPSTPGLFFRKITPELMAVEGSISSAVQTISAGLTAAPLPASWRPSKEVTLVGHGRLNMGTRTAAYLTIYPNGDTEWGSDWVNTLADYERFDFNGVYGLTA